MSSDDDSLNNHYISDEDDVPKKRRKPKKDPNKPKRNMSAFFLYSNANRDRVKEENPGVAFGQIVSTTTTSYYVSFLVWMWCMEWFSFIIDTLPRVNLVLRGPHDCGLCLFGVCSVIDWSLIYH